MLHTCAFNTNVAALASYAQVKAVADGVLTQSQAGNFVLTAPMKLKMAWVGGTTITQARLNIASFRGIFLPELNPIDRTVPPGSRPNIIRWFGDQLLLPRVDEIELDTSNALAAGNEQHFGVLWLGDDTPPAPAGPSFSITYTATITAAVRGWTSGTLTLGQTLPGGIYSIVGMACYSATLVAARLVVPGTPWRPGCIGGPNNFTDPWWFTRFGQIGELARFQSFAPPNLEILCNAADTSQSGVLDLVKVS